MTLFLCLFAFVHNPLLILYVRDFLSCQSSCAGCSIPWEGKPELMQASLYTAYFNQSFVDFAQHSLDKLQTNL